MVDWQRYCADVRLLDPLTIVDRDAVAKCLLYHLVHIGLVAYKRRLLVLARNHQANEHAPLFVATPSEVRLTHCRFKEWKFLPDRVSVKRERAESTVRLSNNHGGAVQRAKIGWPHDFLQQVTHHGACSFGHPLVVGESVR